MNNDPIKIKLPSGVTSATVTSVPEFRSFTIYTTRRRKWWQLWKPREETVVVHSGSMKDGPIKMGPGDFILMDEIDCRS